MNTDRWQRLKQLFSAAAEMPIEEQAEFLAAECGSDVELREEVLALLTSAERDIADGLGAAMRTAAQEVAGDDTGRKIGAYRVIRRLGQGGMGRVLLAVRDDEEFDKQVAIKLLRREFSGEEMKKRFRLERQILAKLEHPNIARLIDGGSTDLGEPYVVMEYVDGVPIDEYCRQQQLTTAERLRLFCTVSDAVHEAHRALIVHRDIKPSNILVSRDGTPKLLDFGIAKLIGSPADDLTLTAMTGPGVRLLTPEYASPEQVRNEMITTAADTYSLGILLYELLTGVRPFQFKERLSGEVERVICEELPEKPSTAVSLRAGSGPVEGDALPSTTARLRRELAGDLDNIIMMALRKEPERRYRSAADLADDLRRHLDGMPVSARPDTWGYRSSKFVRRHVMAVITAAAFVLLLTSAAVSLAIQSQRIARQRDRAVTAETEANRQRDRALEAEARAKVEAATANQVADFLVGLFANSAPDSVPAAQMTVRDVLDRGAERVTQELATQPEVQARMMDVMGRVYGQLDIVDLSAKMATAAMELRRQRYGEEHLEIANSLMSMGAVHYRRGEFAAAESCYRRALDMRQKLIGEDDPAIAAAMEGMASVKHYQGKFAEAEQFYRGSLNMLERVYGESHPEVARATRALAGIIMASHPPEEAEAMYRKALVRYQKLHGDEHLATVDCMSDLAVILKNRKAYEEAEPMYRQVLNVRRHVLGEDHSDYAQSLNNYATFLRTVGRADESIEMYRQALEIYRKTLGAEHPSLAIPLINLAAVLSKQEKYEEALTTAREAEAVSAKTMGEDYWVTNYARVQVGWTLFHLGQFEEAEQVLLAAHAQLLAALGPRNARTVTARERLFDFYEAREMPERAAEYAAAHESATRP